MPLVSISLLIALLGVDVGWRPLSDDTIEYIIQLAPEELEGLSAGDLLAASDVPPDLPPIRAYRIIVGRQALPREVPRPKTATTASSSGEKVSTPRRDSPEPGQPDNPEVSQSSNLAWPAQSAAASLSEKTRPRSPSAGPSPDSDQQSGNRSLSSGPVVVSQQTEAASVEKKNLEGAAAILGASSVHKAPPVATTETRAPVPETVLWKRGVAILSTTTAFSTAGLALAVWAVLDYRSKYLKLLNQIQAEQTSA